MHEITYRLTSRDATRPALSRETKLHRGFLLTNYYFLRIFPFPESRRNFVGIIHPGDVFSKNIAYLHKILYYTILYVMYITDFPSFLSKILVYKTFFHI